MDSKEFDRAREDRAPAAEVRPRPEGDAPQAAGGPGCQSNTRGQTSQIYLDSDATYPVAGGIDWFEWFALIHWDQPDRFSRACGIMADAKQACQSLQRGYFEIVLPDFGPVRVRRFGFTRGGERGQHLEMCLEIPGATIGVANRDLPPTLSDHDRNKAQPNFIVRATGRQCLLHGAIEGYELAEALITALGGTPIVKRLSRADLRLDIVNMDAKILLAFVEAGQFITRASVVDPKRNLVSNEASGFCAGRHPLYLTVYDKVLEQLGKTDALYLRALIDRCWGGVIPETAVRIEFQMSRRWLREQGIDSPEHFLLLRGRLCEKLTHEFFRLTAEPVDRRNNHQSRVATHPLWQGIQKAFEAMFGPPEGALVPLDRTKVHPIALARQGRGCLANCLLQIGVEFDEYRDFVRECGKLLLSMFPSRDDQELFMEEIRQRQMEYLAS